MFAKFALLAVASLRTHTSEIIVKMYWSCYSINYQLFDKNIVVPRAAAIFFDVFAIFLKNSKSGSHAKPIPSRYSSM